MGEKFGTLVPLNAPRSDPPPLETHRWSLVRGRPAQSRCPQRNNVAEAGDVFEGIQILHAVRRVNNFVVIANGTHARSLPTRD